LEEEEARRRGRERIGSGGSSKTDGTTTRSGTTHGITGNGESESVEPLPPVLPKRFYASATLHPDRVGRDAGKIADEILSHLSTLPRARLRVSVEIEAEMPEGAPEDVQRTVSENAKVLKFESCGFEREWVGARRK
jgi:hypothetical protein